MIIQVDTEGKELIVALMDLALKGVGVNAMGFSNKLMQIVKLIEEPKDLQNAKDTKIVDIDKNKK